MEYKDRLMKKREREMEGNQGRNENEEKNRKGE